MFIYRLRNIESLLDTFQELEKQEIYFASNSEMNDPMEGFRDIFWLGDQILWTNFIKHYYFNLFWTLSVSNEMEYEKIPILLSREINQLPFEEETLERIPYSYLAEIYPKSENSFINRKHIQEALNFLKKWKKRIRRDILEPVLHLVHSNAYDQIVSTFKEFEFLPELTAVLPKDFPNLEIRDLINEFQKDKEPNDKVYRNLFRIEKDKLNGLHLELLHQANYRSRKDSQEVSPFPVFEFPLDYLRKIEKIVHPEWYAACFLSSCRSSSAWGHYANGHKGVCLKFKLNRNKRQLHLALKEEHSYTKEHLFPFHKVSYTGKYPKIDFFRSMAKIPIHQLISQWYADEKLNRSKRASELLANNDKWAKAYWNRFIESLNTKLSHWKHEKEYRLIQLEQRGPIERKMKYRFQDLDGIIFGLRTSKENKLRVIEIIDQKCREQERHDFSFYQAYYSEKSGNIEYYKLNKIQVG